MNKKELVFGVEAREKLLKGLEKTYNAVSTTLGPCGRNVIIKSSIDDDSPTVTKDGVTVARDIKLEDKFEDIGAQLLREVSKKTDNNVGDGTTTSTVIAYSIAKEGMKAISTGAKPLSLKQGIDKATNLIVNKIKDLSIEISGSEDIKNVATISANNDEVFGSLVSEAFEKVGKNGIITVGESKTLETKVNVVNGLRFNSGYLSPYFVTDKQSMISEFNDPFIFVTDKTISVLNDLISVLESVAKSGKPLVIIADNVDGEALAALVVNTLRGALKVVAIKSPWYGENKTENLNDICAVTGATLISDNTGYKFSQVNLSHLGTCNSIKVTKDDTTLIGNNKNNELQLKERIDELESRLKSPETLEYEKLQLKERIGKLSGGIAVIEVGAATETEMKEKKFRLDDTLAATRAAVEEGIVPGGGSTLLKAAESITEDEYKNFDIDVQMGFKIVKKAIELPAYKIAENAGLSGDVIVENLKRTLNKVDSSKDMICYDAYHDNYSLAFEVGIVDPTKVVRCALQNAASIAGLLITSECIIVDKEENKND